MEPKNGRQQTSSETKPKRVGRPPGQRPKLLPLKVRQRLINLGVEVATRDTTDQHLKQLISTLSADLQRYQMAAEHWQKKAVEFQKTQKLASVGDQTAYEAETTENNESLALLTKSDSIEIIHNEFIQTWRRTVSPTLDMVVVPLPQFRLSLNDALSGARTETFFSGVLMNVSRVGSIFGVFKASSCDWGPIARLMPDFSEARGRELWAILLDPIHTAPHSLHWRSGPSCRTDSVVESMIYDEDPDYDLLDRRLLSASDSDVLDMLHYCCILLMGLNHALYDNPHYENVREHLGSQMERLLREAIFSRNLGAHPQFAHEFYISIIDSLFHFTATARFGALHSLQEIAWRVCTTHPTAIHPILKSQILYQSTIWATNPTLRQVWLARSLENIESSDLPYFHMTSTTYFAGCFVALADRDLESLLHYLSKLEAVLTGNISENSWVSGAVSSPSSTVSSSSNTDLMPFESIIMPMTDPWHQHDVGEGIIALNDPIASPWNDVASRESTSSSDTIYDALDQRVFVEEEHGKTCLNSGLKLLRAEASLLAGDTEMCIHWVDEAEKEILKLPDLLILQKMFVQETPCASQVFQTVCPFPAGNHTIAAELERRVTEKWQPRMIDPQQPE